MKPISLIAALLVFALPAAAAPPPSLREVIANWAGSEPVSRFQFSLADLNDDQLLDAVVHITDPKFCANGGCPIVVFKRTPDGYELIGSSGLVRKPVYVLKETLYGWHSLAAIVGLNGASPRPIRYLGETYNPDPYLRKSVDLSPIFTERALDFEEVQ